MRSRHPQALVANGTICELIKKVGVNQEQEVTGATLQSIHMPYIAFVYAPDVIVAVVNVK